MPTELIDRPSGAPTTLVGRAGELDRLARAIGVADPPPGRSIGPRHAVVAGDAGIGKTRLLTALADQIADAGPRAVVGHCLDFGTASLPYLPFTEIFGQLQTVAADEVATIARRHRAIRRLLPAERMQPDDADESHVARTELFDAVARSFDQLADERGLVIMIEDLHWADPSSRDLITYLTSRRFAHQVSLVLSYRSDDLVRSHPLRAALANWSRLEQVVRIDLPPLPDQDLRTVVARQRPDLPSTEMAAVVARAEGNTFFAEELAAAAGAGDAVPADLAGLLLLRLDGLTEAARHVVRIASVAGRQVGHQLLALVAELPEAELDDAIRDAVESQVLIGKRDGYHFRHALVGEAVYDDLLPGERTRFHARYVTALQQPGVDQIAAELARHARAAHDLPTAFRASVDAGDEASRVGGPDDALDHYRFALQLADRPEDHDHDRAASPSARLPTLTELTIKASDAAETAGYLDQAIELLRDLLEQRPDLTGPLRATALQALAATLLYSDYNLDERPLVSEAMELIDPERDRTVYAKLMATRARSSMLRGRYEDAVDAAERATAVGRELGLHRVVADQTILRARITQRLGDPEASVREIQQLLTTAATDGDTTTQLRGHDQLGGIKFEQGKLTEALEAYRRGAEAATRIGRRWSPHGIDAATMAAQTAYVLGDWEQCLELSSGAEGAPGIARANLELGVLAVAAGRGDTSALDRLPGLRSWWRFDTMITINCSPAIELHTQAGDLDAAIGLHDDITATIESVAGPHFTGRVRLGGLLITSINAVVAAGGVDEGARDQLAGRARKAVEAAHATLNEVERVRTLGPEAYAWLARVDAEDLYLQHQLQGSGDPDALITAWELAIDRFDAYAHAFEAARCRARLAAVLDAYPDHDHEGRVDDLITEARQIADRLQARPLLAELRRLDGGGSTPAGAGSSEPAPENPLTDRERQVLALVADGLSNREVGDRLVISGKTASVHVSNILTKLDAGSRTEAVALARRRGLLG